jgi:hypothetical protein
MRAAAAVLMLWAGALDAWRIDVLDIAAEEFVGLVVPQAATVNPVATIKSVQRNCRANAMIEIDLPLVKTTLTTVSPTFLQRLYTT